MDTVHRGDSDYDNDDDNNNNNNDNNTITENGLLPGDSVYDDLKVH